MTKKEYIKRQIAKTNKKDYENYVVTRIIHLLDDLELKFVTQQYVKRPEGYALADLYFPQLNIFIEVDEAQHISQQEADKKRDRDFKNMLGVEPFRINVAYDQENQKEVTIEEVHEQIDVLLDKIRETKVTLIKQGVFKVWDIDEEYNPDTWIAKGTIAIEDNVAFRTIVDACRCMGLNYAGYQRAGATHPYEKDTMIWFPKLYPNGVWQNSYDEESGIIMTSNIKSLEEQKSHVDARLKDERKRRIVFARIKDDLGDINYKFRGVFEMDQDSTNYENGVVWKQISQETKTYDYKLKI
ncbi:MAG: hypothetical protein GY827_00410 [Cytophagales bacterium]|nr:hypothetical protein [Cytophagales bacterium]